MRNITPAEQLQFLSGRLCGLAGTSRHDLTDAVRAELKELAEIAASIPLPEVFK